MVGAPGFEPGVIRSQSEHVSRYTTLRYCGLLQYYTKNGDISNKMLAFFLISGLPAFSQSGIIYRKLLNSLM